MTETADTACVNAEQRAFWNSEVSERWVAQQHILDHLMEALTRRLRERSAIAGGERVVDVGCGAGTTSLALAGLVGESGRILGIDISEPMLARARQRAAAAGVHNVEFRIADAQTYGFEAGGFDLVSSRFGVMFFEAPTAAFANLATALRSGGRLACVSWAPLADNPWFRIPREVAIGHLGAPEPASPTAPGALAFADADYVEGILSSAGFEAIRIEAETVPLDFQMTLAAVARFVCDMGPAGRLIRLNEPPAETVARIADEIAEAFQDFVAADGIEIPASLNYIEARRP
jgi:SAM-dependent methyltransferase